MMTKDNKEAVVPAVGELQELSHVPKLPFVGSMIPQYSGTTLLELTTVYDNWYSLYEKPGKFYNIGFPSLGKGIYGDGKFYSKYLASLYMYIRVYMYTFMFASICVMI